jgi:GT2 family glycosyltransferase
MTRPVSVVLPALDDPELFEQNLPPLLEELADRATGDEVLVVDDTGEDRLRAALGARFPAVRVLARGENGGFARALRTGVEAADHELVFAMNPDVRVRRGFLDPLVACLAEQEVVAVVPRILLGGDEKRIESLTELRERGGLVELVQPGLQGASARATLRLAPTAFAVGGACLFRRSEFLAQGFDALFEPFYWEDVDWGWSAWRRGRRILYQPASVVEHHHRGTIGRRIEQELVRAAIEKNRLLFAWKHLDEPELLRRHLAALYRWALDAWIEDRRDDLVWLALALDQREEALAARRQAPRGGRSFGELSRLARAADT